MGLQASATIQIIIHSFLVSTFSILLLWEEESLPLRAGSGTEQFYAIHGSILCQVMLMDEFGEQKTFFFSSLKLPE